MKTIILRSFLLCLYSFFFQPHHVGAAQPLWEYVSSPEFGERILHGWGQSVDRWENQAIPYYTDVGVPSLVSDYVAMSELGDGTGIQGDLARLSSWTAPDGTIHPFIVMECLTHELDLAEVIAALNDLGYPIDPADPDAAEQVRDLLEDPEVRDQVMELVPFPDVAVAQGDWDTEITRLAHAVRSMERPVLVRFMQEFLGGVHSDDVSDPESFKDAWRHFVDLMRSQGATNAEFVWHPNAGDTATLEEWWPGDEYVDWVAVSVFSGADFDVARTHNAFALSHEKPFLVAESAPTLHEFADRGTTDPATWEDYFVPYFDLIRSEENIKAFFYINIDWTDSAFDWPTSRVQETMLIHNNYMEELADPLVVNNQDFWEVYDPDSLAGHLLFSSGFEPESRIDLIDGNHHVLRGADAGSGFDWETDFPAMKGTFQYEIGTDPPDEYVSTSLVYVDGPDGTFSPALEMKVFQDYPFDGTRITRNNFNVKPFTDGSFDQGYIRYWMKFQDDFLTAWPGGDGAWKIILEWMEETPPGEDDFNWRMGVSIRELDGVPRWVAYADRGNPVESDWGQFNPFVDVPIREWFLLEAYWNIGPAVGEDRGRLWFAVNGETVFDLYRNTQHPENPLPVNRWFPFKNYQHIEFWNAPAVQWIDEFEWWSGFPPGRMAEEAAFPGAEGFGSQTPGGSNGKVVRVTSLEDSGPGTLREALMLQHPRTIVFDVAGTIHLDRPLFLGGEPGETHDGDNPYSFCTIAGQTAPGGGVTITNFPLSIRNGVHDVVVQHLRFRNQRADPMKSSIGDGVQLAGASNVVLDHLSVAWATDEGISLEATEQGPIHDVTIKNCLIAETLTNGDHPNGNPHSRGLVISDGARNISVHHNFFISCNKRNPSLAGNSDLGQSEDPVSDVRYNLVYNFGEKGMQFSGGAQTNLVGNIVRFGPDTVAETIFDAPDTMNNGTTVFLEGNMEIRRVDGEDIITLPADQQTLVTEKEAGSVTYAIKPFDTPEITRAHGNLEEWILTTAGAHPRDVHDLSFIADYEAFTGRLGADGLSHDEITIIDPESGDPLPDSDGDGMNDNWETLFGLDPGDPSDGFIDPDGDGYTNFEIFLEELSQAQQSLAFTGYDHWVELRFSEEDLGDEEIVGRTSDPDRDGIDNLTEYFIGTDPKNISNSSNDYLWFEVTHEEPGGDQFVLQLLHLNRLELVATVEESQDLLSWEERSWSEPDLPLGGGMLLKRHETGLTAEKLFQRVKIEDMTE